MNCERHGHHAGICWDCADEAGRQAIREARAVPALIVALRRAREHAVNPTWPNADSRRELVADIDAALRSAGMEP